MTVKAKPDGYNNVIPYILARNAEALQDFIINTFNGVEKDRVVAGGTLRHGEVVIGDSMIMLAEATDQSPACSGMFYIYCDDVDAVYKKGLANGAKSLMEPALQFYGDRSGGFEDNFGNQWWVATHVEDVPPEEMERRVKEKHQK